MKSRTSFFNGSVLRKNITRFAPVWVLYTVMWILITVPVFDGNVTSESSARSWVGISDALPFCNILYASLCAYLLFGDLFKPRMCNALHAMPIRREGWMLYHTLSALFFALIPYLFTCAIVAARMPSYWLLAAAWFAVAMLQFLFFFGLAVFSAMCAGNVLGMGAVYLILNFFALLVYALFYLLYEPLLHGIVETINITPYIPVTHLVDEQFMKFKEITYISTTPTSQWSWNDEYWFYLGICTAIGIAAWFIALVLYRKRKLECAGDFVAFRPVAPFFLIFYTLGIGTILYLIADSIMGNSIRYVFLTVGIFVGFFTGKMLLYKTIRVFSLKSFLQFGLFGILLAGSLILTWMDPAGITYYVPKTEDIVGVRIYSADDYYTYKNDSIAQAVMATESDEIESLRNMHSAMTTHRTLNPDTDNCEVNVVYLLKNGSYCKREYTIDVRSELGQQLENHLSQYQQVFFTNDWLRYVDSVEEIWAESVYSEDIPLPYDDKGQFYLTDEQIPHMLEALKADCDAGCMAQDWAFYRNYAVDEFGEESICWLQIDSNAAIETLGTDFYTTGTRQVSLHITTRCENTVAYLESLCE